MAEIAVGNVEALGKPLGQYSHLARARDVKETLYIAGMLAPGTDFEAQCAAVYEQIGAALGAAGAGWAHVVQFTTYLVDARDIPAFRAWRLREFPRLFPAGTYPPNTLLIVQQLIDPQYRIEVQTTAAL